MKNALSQEFIHRCIYNACPQNEWLPVAHVCTCVWLTHTCLCKTASVYIACAVCQGDRTTADWWDNVCFNEPLEWLHLEKDLVAHFTVLLLLSGDIWGIHHQSIARICVCMCACFVCLPFCVLLVHFSFCIASVRFGAPVYENSRGKAKW